MTSVIVLGGAGCSSAEIDENNPTILLKEAEDDIESSRYILALEKLQKIKNQHPYSKEAVEAAIRIGDVYFLQESYAEAAATYEAFRDLHPKHPRLAYAAYRVGLAFYSDLPGNHARDLTSGVKAEEAFKEYLAQFPTDENAASAREKLAETRRRLSEKEMYIGNFYFKREKWEAAKGRYQKVVNLYTETPFAEEAKKRLKEIEEKPPEKTE
jgi:outer membrane protein assembly factor BamD